MVVVDADVDVGVVVDAGVDAVVVVVGVGIEISVPCPTSGGNTSAQTGVGRTITAKKDNETRKEHEKIRIAGFI